MPSSSSAAACGSSADTPVVATLVGSKRKNREAASAVKDKLECAICLTTMFPPIRQCAEGCNFCNKCASKLMASTAASARKCPMCRSPLSNPVARARNLEQWATEADVEVTCDHEECGVTFKYSDYAEHRKTCVGCVVACPLGGCSWRGEPKDLPGHLLAAAADGGHALKTCPTAAKFSNRHRDYSTTVIFETKRRVGSKRRWRPPRQLVVVPANAKLGTEACTFAVALWKNKGSDEPFMAAISSVRKPGHEETPWSFDISLSAYPRPPQSLCVARASMCGTVRDLDAREVWTRPALGASKAPILATDAASMRIFNTAHLDDNGNSSGQQPTCAQRYEVHVRLMPLTSEVLAQQAEREGIYRGTHPMHHGRGRNAVDGHDDDLLGVHDVGDDDEAGVEDAFSDDDVDFSSDGSHIDLGDEHDDGEGGSLDSFSSDGSEERDPDTDDLDEIGEEDDSETYSSDDDGDTDDSDDSDDSDSDDSDSSDS